MKPPETSSPSHNHSEHSLKTPKTRHATKNNVPQPINHEKHRKSQIPTYTASPSVSPRAAALSSLPLYSQNNQSHLFTQSIHHERLSHRSSKDNKTKIHPKLPGKQSDEPFAASCTYVFRSPARGRAGAHVHGHLCGCPCASVPSETDG